MSADVLTVRLRMHTLLEGTSLRIDDLEDDAFVLVAATLPRSQDCADATTGAGLRALGLPDTYPTGGHGGAVGHDICQSIGARIRAARLRGIWCRSACTADGRGRELAWFPATRRSNARPVWDAPLPLGTWRHATRWSDIGLDDQPNP